jgi:hypothetical protein
MSDLYDSDFHEWAETQAGLLRRHASNALDWDNLAEEIESLGKSQRREVRRRLALICQHLLKWQYQPEHQSRSWESTIRVQRRDLLALFEDSPSLRSFAASQLSASFDNGREDAERESGLLHLPAACPWTVEQVLDQAFWPSGP